jgi:hypothetical protein
MVPRLRTCGSAISWAGVGQQRQPGLQHRAGDEVVLDRHRADAHGRAAVLDAPQLVDAVQVDQVLGLREAQLHHRQQAVAAGQQLGFAAQAAQQADSLGHRARCVVIEGGWDHAGLLWRRVPALVVIVGCARFSLAQAVRAPPGEAALALARTPVHSSG